MEFDCLSNFLIYNLNLKHKAKMDDYSTREHENDQKYLNLQESYQLESFQDENEFSGQLMATSDKVL